MIDVLMWIGVIAIVPAGYGLGWLIATLQFKAEDKARAKADERVRKLYES